MMEPGTNDEAKVRARLIAAAMALAAAGRWPGLDLAEIAQTASVADTAVPAAIRDRHDLLAALWAEIDEAAEAAGAEDADDPALSVRDRLFSRLMARFDAMTPHRAGLKPVLTGLPADAGAALRGGPALARSMRRDLAGAGAPAAGPAGLVRAQALAGLFLLVLRVWLEDESADLAATMAALDRHLARAERLAATIDPCARRNLAQDIAEA